MPDEIVSKACRDCGALFSGSELNVRGLCIECERAADDDETEIGTCPCGDEACS